ncbi:MAG: ATPase, partial [Spirochaetaceae bacterium]|nr:ATPase [Spirochaetaceae bacterium]
MDFSKTALGIELGSTRIKAVLIDENHAPVAQGSFDWENRLENGIWTYHLDDVWTGLQAAFRALRNDVKARCGAALESVGAIGISAMMHGYLPFDKNGKQLAEFRTWRNTTTAEAAKMLSLFFEFNIPQRWSIAHLYQAMLNGEPHTKEIAFLTTLAGYVHWKLTGKKVLGVGDASGMFPVDGTNYSETMLSKCDEIFAKFNAPPKLRDILPVVLSAGDDAGTLTEEGALLLSPDGAFKAGIPLCPPEGDAGTGMTATNSIAERTGNVSAGTSIFAMLVLEKPLSKRYEEIDMVTTPTGKPVAMVHCNNCTGDLDGWTRLFGEAAALFGAQVEKSALYDALYNKTLEGDADCGGLLNYNYFSGEPITGLKTGRPLFMREPDAKFNLANFMRCQIFSALATLRLGMDILLNENVKITALRGHGGLYKTEGVGQKITAAAL